MPQPKTGSWNFAGISREVMDSPNYQALSFPAKALLQELAYQFRGKNNGDLCTAAGVLKPKGWRSTATLVKATQELVHFGMIERTRQGRRNCCNLYALTWLPVDHCAGKLDAGAANPVASKLWSAPRGPFVAPKKNKTTYPANE